METSGEQAERLGAKHLSQDALLAVLKSSTTGRASWRNTRQRLEARKLVELHAEHLIDFIPFKKTSAGIADVVNDMFEKG